MLFFGWDGIGVTRALPPLQSRPVGLGRLMIAFTARHPVIRDLGQLAASIAAALPLADGVHQLQRLEQGRGVPGRRYKGRCAASLGSLW